MSRSTRLWVVLAANLALVGALLAVGVLAHSVGVWAEGVDYLTDAAAIGLALLAMRLQAPTTRRPRGFPRATRYAALVNAGWLLILSVLVTGIAAYRLVTGVDHVDGLQVLVISGIAAGVMFAGALLLGQDAPGEAHDEGGELSVRAVLLDTAADAAAAAGVAVAGAVILVAGGLYWLDPATALAISVVVAYHAVRLLVRIRVSLNRNA